MEPVVQSTNETPNGPLELRVYPGGDCHGSLYEDDGRSFAYQRGEFLRMNFTCQSSPESITINSAVDHSAYQPWWSSAQVSVYGIGVQPKEVRYGDKMLRDWHYDSQSHCVMFTLSDARKAWTVRLEL